MLTVYGTDWCDDTRRALRHLRRLGIPHRYLNVDDDLDALDRARSLNGDVRRTPTIDLGLGGPALVDPDNDTLTGALIEIEMLSSEDAAERLGVQNVGDADRIARTLVGLAVVAAAGAAPRPLRWPVRILGVGVALSGVAGWCPLYYAARVTSLGGLGDRPTETNRSAWLLPVPSAAAAVSATAVPEDVQ